MRRRVWRNVATGALAMAMLLGSIGAMAAENGNIVDTHGVPLKDAIFAGLVDDGKTAKLTVDAALQQVAERELARTIDMISSVQWEQYTSDAWREANKDTLAARVGAAEELRTAEKGAVVVMDMEGRILAMVSHPAYEDTPATNNAIAMTDKPGSLMKPVTALAALSKGVLTPNETISDEGYFVMYDILNPPHCWIGQDKIHFHAHQTVVEGLANNCDYFFYTIASRLGSDGELLFDFASRFGLAGRTHIELPGEQPSVVGGQRTLYDPQKPLTLADQGSDIPLRVRADLMESLRMAGLTYGQNIPVEKLDACAKTLMDMAVASVQGREYEEWIAQIHAILIDELGMTQDMVQALPVRQSMIPHLNRIKWEGSKTLELAAGESITRTTPLGMARYITVLANGGKVYNVRIVEQIASADGTVLQSFQQEAPMFDMSVEVGEYLPYIHRALHGIVDASGLSSRLLSGWKYRADTAGMTSTVPTSALDLESNAWFAAFAPLDEPEIAVVVYVPHGIGGGMLAQPALAVIDHYMESKGN